MPHASGPVLTPSRLAAFGQCPRRLWLGVHRPELAGTAAKAPAFEASRTLGAIARQLSEGATLDAGFEHDGVRIRADILESDGAGGWRLIEVKRSARLKDYHIEDLATQAWAIAGCGLTLSAVVVRHVDTGFVLSEEGDYRGLFADHDLTRRVAAAAQDRSEVVAAARAVLAGEEPGDAPGPQCTAPFTCEFAAHCASTLPPPPEWPVAVLPNGGWKKWARQGYADLLDLDEAALKPSEAMIVAATRSGVPFHDVAGARKAMAEWSYPRAWLDFETISAAVPRWIGTRPYQQVPFQFSLHLEAEDGTITHHEYLCCDGSDPRPGCAEALVQAILPEATVIAYNAGFERAVLRALAAQVPAHEQALLVLAGRTVDLLPVARANWYHRDQRGSWSIKALLPTLASLDYAGLEVKDGAMAQESFLEAADPATTPERRWALEEALRAYCERDTWAMVLVARVLAGEVGA